MDPDSEKLFSDCSGGQYSENERELLTAGIGSSGFSNCKVGSLARLLSLHMHAPCRPGYLVFLRLFYRLVSRLLGTPVWSYQPVILGYGYRGGGIRLTSMVEAFELARVDLM